MKETIPKSAKSVEINLLYYLPLFLVLAWVHLLSVLTIHKELPWPFFINSVVQCLLEVSFFAVVSGILSQYKTKKWFYFFTALFFWCSIAQTVDFFLIRFMGFTVWYFIDCLRREELANLVEIFRATSVSFTTWFLAAGGIVAISGVGLFLFSLTHKWKRSSITLSYKFLTILFFSLLGLLLSIETVFIQKESFHTYEKFRSIIPFKRTFLSPTAKTVLVKAPLQKAKDLPPLASLPLAVSKKPNIFLFVIESLRADAVTKETAPNLFQFKETNLSFDLAASGGNATHLSWFSIFHAQFPFRWSQLDRSKEHLGAYPLRVLKEMGYKIHVYTTPPLDFYRMGDSILGDHLYLADSVKLFSDSEIPCWQRDRNAINSLIQDAHTDESEGHLYITFLDATHFGYSWPEALSPFTCPKTLDYLKAAFSEKSVLDVKNRYKNAVYFIDSLFDTQLQSAFPKDAIVMITGDHGEEFYEDGQLFHASNLNVMQTEVPLYYRFGEDTASLKEKASKLTSHMDIFPTLLSYLNPSLSTGSFLEGESIFSENKWPFAVSARYNVGLAPYEFCIHSLDSKLTLWFPSKETLPIRVLSLRDRSGRTLPHDSLEEQFAPALDRLYTPAR